MVVYASIIPPSLLSCLLLPQLLHSCWAMPVSASTSLRTPQEPPQSHCSGGGAGGCRGWVLSPAIDSVVGVAIGVVSPAALQRLMESVWFSTNQRVGFPVIRLPSRRTNGPGRSRWASSQRPKERVFSAALPRGGRSRGGPPQSGESQRGRRRSGDRSDRHPAGDSAPRSP